MGSVLPRQTAVQVVFTVLSMPSLVTVISLSFPLVGQHLLLLIPLLLPLCPVILSVSISLSVPYICSLCLPPCSHTAVFYLPSPLFLSQFSLTPFVTSCTSVTSFLLYITSFLLYITSSFQLYITVTARVWCRGRIEKGIPRSI